MAVHLYGHPADMTAINAIARKHGIPVIEDAAEAHGAEVNGIRVGGLGLAATFSFYGNKIITTGEGGMITTNDDQLAARIRQLKGQGMDPNRRYWFPIVGYNYRMTNMAAALGCAQLERIDELISGRIRIAASYDKHLKPVANELKIQLSSQAPFAKSVYWLYCIRVEKQLRDSLMAYLDSLGIETRPFFPPMHQLPMYEDISFVQGRSLHGAEDLGSTGINLPTWNELTDEQIGIVCDQIISYLRKNRI
jgi:perosamine synthetase